MKLAQQIARYLYLGKKDPSAPDSQALRVMHGINRISLLLFIAAIFIMTIRGLLK